MSHMKLPTALAAVLVITLGSTGAAASISVLFIGNSFLFGSGSAVRFYRANAVTEALVTVGSLTGRDPRSLGDAECSGFELGLSRAEMKTLQQVAFDQLGSAVTASPLVTAKPAPAARCEVPRP